MGRHRAPNLTAAILCAGLVVVAAVVALALLIPPLPRQVVYRPDVRAPVKMPGQSYLPVTTGP